mmetsp:Transcript_42534/g.120324  ORF Transcript_42534/g.120324 Transcript_42534/m.120324 type:complete len:577 (-) Transcript_42534:198-1928(-)
MRLLLPRFLAETSVQEPSGGIVLPGSSSPPKPCVIMLIRFTGNMETVTSLSASSFASSEMAPSRFVCRFSSLYLSKCTPCSSSMNETRLAPSWHGLQTLGQAGPSASSDFNVRSLSPPSAPPEGSSPAAPPARKLPISGSSSSAGAEPSAPLASATLVFFLVGIGIFQNAFVLPAAAAPPLQPPLPACCCLLSSAASSMWWPPSSRWSRGAGRACGRSFFSVPPGSGGSHPRSLSFSSSQIGTSMSPPWSWVGLVQTSSPSSPWPSSGSSPSLLSWSSELSESSTCIMAPKLMGSCRKWSTFSDIIGRPSLKGVGVAGAAASCAAASAGTFGGGPLPWGMRLPSECLRSENVATKMSEARSGVRSSRDRARGAQVGWGAFSTRPRGADECCCGRRCSVARFSRTVEKLPMAGCSVAGLAPLGGPFAAEDLEFTPKEPTGSSPAPSPADRLFMLPDRGIGLTTLTDRCWDCLASLLALPSATTTQEPSLSVPFLISRPGLSGSSSSLLLELLWRLLPNVGAEYELLDRLQPGRTLSVAGLSRGLCTQAASGAVGAGSRGSTSFGAAPLLASMRTRSA